MTRTFLKNTRSIGKMLSMTFDEYVEIAKTTLKPGDGKKFGDLDSQLIQKVLGLTGESGEVADKIKKLMRDKNNRLTDVDREEIVKELGDVLWYVAIIAHLLGSSLEAVAIANNEKLQSRKQRGVISGNGDNR